MKLPFLLVVALFIATIARPAYSESDLFSGLYRFRMPNQPGMFVVESIGEGKWRISSSETEGQPVKPFPVPGMPPMVVASTEVINSWFDQASPRDTITCLAWTGSSRGVFSICRVPTDATYRVKESMSSKRDKSESGYIFVAGTPAGAMTGDLTRAQ